MIPDNINYVFLDVVFETTEGDAVLYEVSLATEKYETSFLRVDANGLSQLAKECVEKGIVTDFSFENNFLKCNSQIRKLPIADQLVATKGIVLQEHQENYYTFFDFAFQAATNSYLIFGDDSIVTESEGSELVTSEARPFNEMLFSQSTMSVYFKVIANNEIYNRVVVYMEDGMLQFRPFYFAVPEGANEENLDDIAKLVGQKVINNLRYSIYLMEFVPLYLANYHASSSIFNRTFNTCVIDMNTIKVLNQLNNLSYSEMGYLASKLTWAGGNGSHESPYGIYFDCTTTPITESKATDWLEEIMVSFVRGSQSLQEAKEKIQAQEWSYSKKLAALCVVNIMFAEMSEPGDVIVLTNSYKEMLVNEYFYAGLYVFKARTQMFFDRKTWIATASNSLLVGSDLKCYTNFKGGLCYGSR